MSRTRVKVPGRTRDIHYTRPRKGTMRGSDNLDDESPKKPSPRRARPTNRMIDYRVRGDGDNE